MTSQHVAIQMIKRILIILFVVLGSSAANAAGTIAFSLSQQFSTSGAVLGGCLLYTIQAGTTSTPQTAYKDTALTLPHPNPMQCDAHGRLPQFFLADGQIKVRLTDSGGTDQFVADNILVIGPSAGGGSGGAVDPTTVLTTGDFKAAYGTGPLGGFVRCNGRTIGSAVSGATERANADTSSLFSFLWGNDPNLAVSGGRGANAAADFAANKTITLPDCRGRVIAGLDDMGSSAASRLTATYWGNTGTCSGTLGTTLGAACGGENRTLAQTNLPNVTLTTNVTDPGHSHAISVGGTGGSTFITISASSVTSTVSGGPNYVNSATTGITASTPLGGSATPVAVMQPTILTTIYIKL